MTQICKQRIQKSNYARIEEQGSTEVNSIRSKGKTRKKRPNCTSKLSLHICNLTCQKHGGIVSDSKQKGEFSFRSGLLHELVNLGKAYN